MEEHSENEIKIKRSIFWKIYFCFIVFITVWGVYTCLIDENLRLMEIIDTAMTLPATIGLFGYVFSKRIYKQWFWICFSGVYLFYNFFSGVKLLLYALEVSQIGSSQFTPIINGFTPLLQLFTVIFVITLTLPAYIGLLLYALPSNKLWKKIER